MKQILVVDDNRMNCVMAKKALEEEYEVYMVYSGTEALAFLEEKDVDLVIMDISMPDISGTETVARIRTYEKWQELPIIFLTADTDPKTEVECLSSGADDFIIKPFVPVVMKTRVSRILEIHELRKELQKKLETSTKQAETATLKSLTDALTGLRNRDYIKKELGTWLKDGGNGAMFMIDLDNFKTMNDTYGHIMGDKTLQQFAEVLKVYSEEKDMVCRLAGDEFVCFYPNLTDKEVACKKAEGIIRTFSNKMGELGYGGIISVSIGIMMAQGGEEFQTVYNKADKALYLVKNNGKNAFHVYDEEIETIEEISTTVDMEYVSRIIKKGLGDQKGAFQLAFDEFKNVYDFVSRCVTRKKQNVQVVLFTMYGLKRRSSVSMEYMMQQWEAAVASSLRAVDTGTKYSSSQYLVILMDSDIENGKAAAERVIKKFYESNESLTEEVKVGYDIRTVFGNREEKESIGG